MLDLTPVPRRLAQGVRKETYRATVAAGTTDRFEARIELYSLDDDPQHTILGASTAAIPNDQTAPGQIFFGKVAFIDTAADGSVTLQDWSQTPFVTGLRRGDTVGEQTTVEVSCTMSGAATPIYQGCTGGKFSLTLTLTELGTVD